MVDISPRLKALRIENGLTQKQVAERVGASVSMISSYENLTRQPPYSILIKLASLYGVTTDYLLGVERGRMICVDNLSDDHYALVLRLVEALRHE